MKTKRIGASVVTVLATVAALTACATDGTEADSGASGGSSDSCAGVRIGLAVNTLRDDFQNQIKQAAEEQAKSRGATLLVADAKGDSATQVNQVQDFLTQQIDVLIYIPAGADAASVPVKAAHDAGVKVVALDRNPPDEPADTFIATDSVAAAKELGDWVVEQTGGEGKVAILQGQIGTTPEMDRDEGFNKALEAAPGLEVVAKQTANWAQDKAYDVATDMLQVNPDISVFFGRSDGMALGAAQAVKSAGIDPRPLIVGFDGDFAGIEAVKDGDIAATMVQQTQEMGRQSVDSACAFADGESVDELQLLDAFLLTTADSAKADEYLEKHP